MSLCGGLERFVIGVDNQVQVDVNAQVMLHDVRVLTEVVKDTEARANLATLEGVLRTYKPLEVPSLVLRSEAGGGLSRIFHGFVEDETYRLLAREAGLLGIPTRASYALVRMRRTATDLLGKPRFRAAADLTAGTIKAASTIPAPASKAGQVLLDRQYYLPPLISLRDAEERAVTKWADAAPPFVSTSNRVYDGARTVRPEGPEARALGFEDISDQ
jgi:FAD/FMN-containing dehydrogenase